MQEYGFTVGNPKECVGSSVHPMAKGHFDNKLIIEDFTQATKAHHGNV